MDQERHAFGEEEEDTHSFCFISSITVLTSLLTFDKGERGAAAAVAQKGREWCITQLQFTIQEPLAGNGSTHCELSFIINGFQLGGFRVRSTCSTV